MWGVRSTPPNITASARASSARASSTRRMYCTGHPLQRACKATASSAKKSISYLTSHTPAPPLCPTAGPSTSDRSRPPSASRTRGASIASTPAPSRASHAPSPQGPGNTRGHNPQSYGPGGHTNTPSPAVGGGSAASRPPWATQEDYAAAEAVQVRLDGLV